MKKIKLSLIAVALLAIGSAFATSNKVNKLTAYYPIANGAGHFTWSSSTNGLSCGNGGPGCAAYSASSAPANDFVPTDYVTDGDLVWK
jgi:hypothetical protein